MYDRDSRHGAANAQHLPTSARLIRACEVVAAVLVPMLALRSGIYQLHPRIGWVDPGLYIYNFFSLPKNMAMLQNVALLRSTPVRADYHFSRLPFVLPGYAIYRVLEPVQAQAALISVFYLLGLAALFIVARTLVTSVAGRLALVWIVALNPLWIAAFAEGYLDGPAITFVLFSFGALASTRPRLLGVPRPFWAGLSAALALSTQPFAGGAAAVVLSIVAVRTTVTWRETLRFLAWAAVGGLCVIAGLGAAGMPFGVPFLYLFAAADWLRRISDGGLHEYVVAPARWLPAATRVALWPIVFALLARVVKRGSPARRPGTAALLVAISGWTVLFLIGDIATGHFFTQFRFYASYLFLPLVPALAVLIEDATDRTPGAVSAFAPVAALALGVALPLAVRSGPLSSAVTTSTGAAIWVGVAALGVAGCIADWIGRRQLGFLGIACALALAGAANRDTGAIFATPTNGDHRAASAAVTAVHKAIAKTGLSDRRILTWFNRDAFTAATDTAAVYEMDFAGRTYRFNLLDTIAASFGWSQTTFGFDMPEVDDTWRRQFSTIDDVPTAVVVLCAHADDCRLGEHTFAAHGTLVNEVAFHRVELPQVPAFWFAILDIRPHASARRD